MGALEYRAITAECHELHECEGFGLQDTRIKQLCVIVSHMTNRVQHLAQYEDFKKGSELKANPPQLRVEAALLATYHLIEACAATHNVHINKHQRVRQDLERNPVIFGDRAEEVWIAFSGHRVTPAAQVRVRQELAPRGP